MLNPVFSINTFSWIWKMPLEQCISHLAQRGHSRFEAIMTPGHVWPSELDASARRKLGQMMASKSLTIDSLNPGGWDNNLISPSKEMRDHTYRYLASVVDLAGDWGVPGVVISPGIARPLLSAPREQMMGWLRESMERLVPRAQNANTRLLFENIPYAWLPRAEQLSGLVQELGCGEHVAMIYDVANAVFIGDDPASDIERVAPHMELVHFSDTTRAEFRHDPIGTGDVPFAEITQALGRVNYDGPIVLEIISSDPDVAIADSIERLQRLKW